MGTGFGLAYLAGFLSCLGMEAGLALLLSALFGWRE